MPMVLRNRKTGEIACGILRNAYDIEYYGAYWWEDNETAETRVSQLLNDVLGEIEEESNWDLLEVKDERLKMFNVKLNNDIASALSGSRWDDNDSKRIAIKGRRLKR